MIERERINRLVRTPFFMSRFISFFISFSNYLWYDEDMINPFSHLSICQQHVYHILFPFSLSFSISFELLCYWTFIHELCCHTIQHHIIFIPSSSLDVHISICLFLYTHIGRTSGKDQATKFILWTKELLVGKIQTVIHTIFYFMLDLTNILYLFCLSFFCVCHTSLHVHWT